MFFFEKNNELSAINEDPSAEKRFMNCSQSFPFQESLTTKHEGNYSSFNFDSLPPEPLIAAPELVIGELQSSSILQHLTHEWERNDSGVDSSCLGSESSNFLRAEILTNDSREESLENSLVQHKRSASDHVVVSASTSMNTTCTPARAKCDSINNVSFLMYM